MVVVTGATGFIGSAFVWQLNELGQSDIVCVDTVSRNQFDYLSNLQYSEFVYADRFPDWLLQSPRAKDIKWIVHLGACSSTTERDTNYLYKNNVEYSIQLWQWCQKNKVDFIYASSAATYGAGELGFSDYTDSEQLNPLNPYGDSKVIFDRWAKKQITHPEHWYGLKFFNVFGPNENHKGFQASVPFKARQEILTTGQLKLFKSHKTAWKDGQQMRDFVYVKDVTRWMAELMQIRPKSDIYNMGFGEARTWLDLARACFRSANRPEKIDFTDIPESIRDNYQYYTKASMQKLLSVGLSAPQWNLERAIHDYYMNYLGAANSSGFLGGENNDAN